MKITRDVITDLLPLYSAGEASPDTRILVEEFLRQNPEFAKLVEQQTDTQLLCPAAGLGLPPDHEIHTLLRTRSLLRRRSWLLSLAMACSVLPLSFAFATGPNGGFSWFMLRDAPGWAGTLWVLAAQFWIFYALTWRKVRTSGL